MVFSNAIADKIYHYEGRKVIQNLNHTGHYNVIITTIIELKNRKQTPTWYIKISYDIFPCPAGSYVSQ